MCQFFTAFFQQKFVHPAKIFVVDSIAMYVDELTQGCSI